MIKCKDHKQKVLEGKEQDQVQLKVIEQMRQVNLHRVVEEEMTDKLQEETVVNNKTEMVQVEKEEDKADQEIDKSEMTAEEVLHQDLVRVEQDVEMTNQLSHKDQVMNRKKNIEISTKKRKTMNKFYVLLMMNLRKKK